MCRHFIATESLDCHVELHHSTGIFSRLTWVRAEMSKPQSLWQVKWAEKRSPIGSAWSV